MGHKMRNMCCGQAERKVRKKRFREYKSLLYSDGEIQEAA